MMIERDLQAASDLLDKIKYAQSSITIAKADAVNLRTCYSIEPFEQDGVRYTKLDAAKALGVDPEEMRAVVHDAIIKHLESKIAEYRKALAKLGVKLDEPPQPESDKLRYGDKTKKPKKLGAPKKPLAIEGPKTPALRAVEN